jgi:tetratricopeptide (TPR) repeat protein
MNQYMGCRLAWWLSLLMALFLPLLCQAAAPGSREDALRDLANSDALVRREAVLWLGGHGVSDDMAALVDALRDDDAGVREFAEGALVQLWSRSGDQKVDALLKIGIKQMDEGLMGQAVDTFSRIVELKPDFAEGWNKRATAYYLMGSYELSLKDCDEVMQRNRFHFGALAGYGLIYVRLGKLEQALEYFERALDVNPNLEGVQQSVALIRYKLGKQGKQET